MRIRTIVRGLITKMPGFQYFSGLNLTLLKLQGMISIPDYQKFQETLYDSPENDKHEYESNFYEETEGY